MPENFTSKIPKSSHVSASFLRDIATKQYEGAVSVRHRAYHAVNDAGSSVDDRLQFGEVESC